MKHRKKPWPSRCYLKKSKYQAGRQQLDMIYNKHIFDRDRLKPVNEGFSLSAYLIRSMTSTMMPQTRDAACETLFALCDKDGKYVNKEQEMKKKVEKKGGKKRVKGGERRRGGEGGGGSN